MEPSEPSNDNGKPTDATRWAQRGLRALLRLQTVPDEQRPDDSSARAFDPAAVPNLHHSRHRRLT